MMSESLIRRTEDSPGQLPFKGDSAQSELDLGLHQLVSRECSRDNTGDAAHGSTHRSTHDE